MKPIAQIKGDGCGNTLPQNEECDIRTLWSVRGTNGVLYQEWTGTDAIDTGNTVPSQEAFTLLDDENLPAHPNPPTTSTTQTTLTQDTNPSGIEQRQWDAWIYVPESVQLRDAGGYLETGEVYIGACAGPMGLTYEWIRGTPERIAFVSLNAGFHRIRVYSNDYSPDFSGLNIQWDLGGSFGTIPANYLFTEKPTINCRPVQICDGVVAELDDTVITITEFDYWCEPSLCSSSTSSAISEMCFKSRQDILAVDNAGSAFGGEVQSITRVVGESQGLPFELDFTTGEITFSGTNGNNQTASISAAINQALDTGNISYTPFENGVKTVSGRYLTWTSFANACPDFNITQVQIERADGRRVNLPIFREAGELTYYTRRACAGCSGGYEWIDSAGNKVQTPDAGCLVPCGESYPAIDPPAPPTCDSSEPSIICYDTTGDGQVDLSVYQIIDICTYEDGQEISVQSYDLQSVVDNPNEPDNWVLTTIPAGSEQLICDGARLIATDTLCDSEGTLHEIRTYELQGVTFQETYIPGTNTESTPVGILGDCGNLYPVYVKKCIVDGLATLHVWNPNYIDAANSDAYTAVFSATDQYGLPAHPTPADTITTSNVLRIYNGNTAGGSSPENAMLEAYVMPNAGDTAIFRVIGLAVETGAVYIGTSPEDAKEVISWINQAANPSATFGSITGGCCESVYVRIYMVDPGPDSADVGLQWSLDDGTTWANIPTTNFSTAPPTCQSDLKWISEGATLALGAGEELGECNCEDITGKEEKRCYPQTFYQIDPTTTQGVNVQYWGNNAVNPAIPTTGSILDAFSETDFFAHINGAADGTGIEPNWTTSSVTIATTTGSTETANDEFLIWGYIFLKKDALLSDINGNSGEVMDFWLGECCGEPKRIFNNDGRGTLTGPPNVNNRTGLFGQGHAFNPNLQLSAGIHWIGARVSDFSAASGFQLQVSYDNAETWTNFPADQSFATKPVINEIKGEYCTDGTYKDLDGNLIDVNSGSISCSPIVCSAVNEEYSNEVTNFPPIQVEYKVPICDGVKNLWQKTTIDQDGNSVITYEDEMGVVSEPATWQVGYCNCDLFTYWEAANVTGTLRNREWSDVLGTGGLVATGNRTKEFANDLIDNFTYPAPTIENDWTTLSTDETDNTSTLTDLQIIDGVIEVTEPTRLRWAGASEGYFRLDIGYCLSEPTTKLCYVHPPNPTIAGISEITIPAGTHNIVIYNLDMGGTNSSQNVQSTTDGINWVSGFGSIQISRIAPAWICKKGYICNGVFYDITKTVVLDMDDPSIQLCQPTCNNSSNSGGSSNFQTLEIN